MRIALLAARLPPATDGVGDHADKLAQALAVAGHEVVVISAGEAVPPLSYRLELAGGSWGPAGTARAVSLFVRQRPEALVVEYTPFLYGVRSPAPLALLLAARARNVRSAVIVHEAFYPAGHDGVGGSALKARLLAVRDRATLRAANEVIVQSAARAEGMAKAVPSLRPHLSVVRIGANVEPPQSYRRAVSSPATVVAFGVVSPRRRLERAIDAVAVLVAGGCDVRLRIIGRIYDRGYAAEMTRRAEAAGVGERVVFCGELAPAALSELLGTAAAAVHAAREGAVASMGALLALLAHGVPTVAVRTPFDDDVFAGALQYTEDGAEPIAATLRALVDVPGAAAALGSTAAALYRAHFAWDNVAAGLIHALEGERTDARLVTA